MDTQQTVQQVIERLYERENLSDNLTDEAAKLLLIWGEGQLKHLAGLNIQPPEIEAAAQQLERVLRQVNRLVGRRTELTETEFLQQLLQLIETSLNLVGPK